MEDLYTCQNCGQIKEEESFTTDINAGQDTDEMTCESCYDEMDANMEDY